jgi:hypothetical protein
MARSKARIQYTLKDYPGILIDVENPRDDEKGRNLAIQEILRRVDDENDPTFTGESFADGLSIDDLIFVEPTTNNDKKANQSDYSADRPRQRTLEPVEIAAKEIAQFSLLRVQLQKNQEVASQYLSAIEALFQSTSLTEEQIELFQRKEFTKTLESLATSKVEHDKFLPKAKEAWKLLKPLITGTVPESVISQIENSKTTAPPIKKG